MSAVAKQEILTLENPRHVASTPMDLLSQAVANGNIELAEKLMALQERYEANQARKAFDAAVSAAKAELKPVMRNRKGHNDKRYADFAAIATAVDPIISKHGLSYRFKSDQGERISVTCILTHRDGHFEQTTLTGPADTTGNKNAIQAIGSTLTYLQRYSLVQMLGLAAGDDDDGAAVNSGVKISEAQLAKLDELANEVGADKIKLCKVLKIEALADLPAARLPEATAILETKRKS